MIFITLGSQKFQLNRLLRWMDEMLEDKLVGDDVFAQTGYSDYQPLNFPFCHFLNRNDFLEKMNKADLIISHAGTGSIVTALKQKKKVIVVPRDEKYGEHVDNHQYEITKNFTSLNLLCSCTNKEELIKQINLIKDINFNDFKSNNDMYINKIKSFIENEVI